MSPGHASVAFSLGCFFRPLTASFTMSAAVNVAVVGATGAVGQEFINVLAERNFPIRSIKFLASARSAGKPIEFNGKTYAVEELTHDSFKDVEVALFSAGGSISK